LSLIDWGRETCGPLGTAESREWLCTNGLGGFASGTAAGLLTRRYHGLLIAALKPPVGRTLLVAKVDDSAEYAGVTRPLFVNRWSDGTVEPHGYQAMERFRLEGTTPVWTYACADALLEKRVWMEHGQNTTYLHYRLIRSGGPLTLELKTLANYRDYHSTTRGEGRRMNVEPIPDGLRVTAFRGAIPFVLLAEGAKVRPAHDWYRGFHLALEQERGLDCQDDHLHVGTFRATLRPGETLTLMLSAEATPSPDGEAAWQRCLRHEDGLLSAWRRAQPAAASAPDWIRHLVLAADQFVVRRPLPDEPDGMSVVAGYPSRDIPGSATGDATPW